MDFDSKLDAIVFMEILGEIVVTDLLAENAPAFFWVYRKPCTHFQLFHSSRSEKFISILPGEKGPM